MTSSSPDPFAEFEDLDRFYPGSKRTRRTLTVETPKPRQVDAGWDSEYYVKTLPNGQVREMYAAGALAKALGRPLVTVRLWERRGYIPAAPYRLPRSVVNGREMLGRRLYTRALIEAAVEAFAKRGLMGQARIMWAEHTDLPIELLETWRRIHAQETSGD